MTTRKIIYKNATNEISCRQIDIVAEDEIYIDAFCHASGEYKTFKKDRIICDVLDIDSDETKQKVAELQKKYEIIKKISREKWKNELHRLEVCFTGFSSKEKNELIEYAKANEFYVRSDVSSNLAFLVCGKTAGPAKLENAKHQGVTLLNKSSFIHLVETGEIIVE